MRIIESSPGIAKCTLETDNVSLCRESLVAKRAIEEIIVGEFCDEKDLDPGEFIDGTDVANGLTIRTKLITENDKAVKEKKAEDNEDDQSEPNITVELEHGELKFLHGALHRYSDRTLTEARIARNGSVASAFFRLIEGGMASRMAGQIRDQYPAEVDKSKPKEKVGFRVAE